VSREAAKPRMETQGAAVVCGELPALLSTFSHLLSMAWMPWPLTPDASPPFHGGEGRKSGQWLSGVHQGLELLQDSGDGFERGFGFFVFECDEAAVTGTAQDVDDAGVVGRLFFAVDAD